MRLRQQFDEHIFGFDLIRGFWLDFTFFIVPLNLRVAIASRKISRLFGVLRLFGGLLQFAFRVVSFLGVFKTGCK